MSKQQSAEVPTELIVAAFQDERGADEALKELKMAKWAGLIGIQDAAVIRRDKKDKLHVKETGDWGGGKGAAAGAVIGGTIGLILGPGAIVTAGVGALIGGVSAKLRDSGFPNDRLAKIGEGLEPETSAIVAVIDHKWVADMEKEMDEAGADVLTEAISADIHEQLAAGGEVSYTALAVEGGLETTRTAVSDDKVEASASIFTEEGVYHEEAVVTDEGVAAERMVITEEGAAYEAVVATEDEATYVAAIETDEGVVAITADAQVVDELGSGEESDEVVKGEVTEEGDSKEAPE